MVGWTDNVNGPIGLMIVAGTDVGQVALAQKDMVLDFIGVDLSIKATIVAVYHRGTREYLIDIFTAIIIIVAIVETNI